MQLSNLSGVDVIKAGGSVTKNVTITDGGIAKDAFNFAGDVAAAAMSGVDKVSTDAIKTVASATRSDAATVMQGFSKNMMIVLAIGFVAMAYMGRKK
ncbi:MAG: hypothetical protein Q9M16_10490 [Mariprofundus sp.]|nr:hypothetical protein [Mariprofundus sp.]